MNRIPDGSSGLLKHPASFGSFWVDSREMRLSSGFCLTSYTSLDSGQRSFPIMIYRFLSAHQDQMSVDPVLCRQDGSFNISLPLGGWGGGVFLLYTQQPPPQCLLSVRHDDNFLRDQLSTPCLAIKYTYSSIKWVLKDIIMDASHGGRRVFVHCIIS